LLRARFVGHAGPEERSGRSASRLIGSRRQRGLAASGIWQAATGSAYTCGPQLRAAAEAPI
jgi:hypothetical protein